MNRFNNIEINGSSIYKCKLNNTFIEYFDNMCFLQSNNGITCSRYY